MTTPDGRTPDAPDVDQPQGGAHDGEDASSSQRGHDTPDVDQPEGGSSG